MSRPGVLISLAISSRRVEARDRLGLEILLHAVAAPLAAVAGLLVATERRGALIRHALQVDVAGADLAADLARALDRAGRDIAREAIGRVVGDLDRVRLVLGAEDCQHRSEDFLSRDRHIV